jgi:hypothetical protein
MAACSQLPSWVSYLQAFAVPALAAVGAWIAVWIAARQMLIAHEKLENEKFDRRYERRLAFYLATTDIVVNILNKKVTEDDLAIYRLKCQEARFLFDGPILEFIHQLERAIGWWYVTGENNKEEHLKFFRPLLSLPIGSGGVIDPGYTLEGQFKPYLVQAPVKRTWWLRWP